MLGLEWRQWTTITLVINFYSLSWVEHLILLMTSGCDIDLCSK